MPRNKKTIKDYREKYNLLLYKLEEELAHIDYATYDAEEILEKIRRLEKRFPVLKNKTKSKGYKKKKNND